MVLTIHSTGEQTSIIKVKPKVRGGTKRIQTVSHHYLASWYKNTAYRTGFSGAFAIWWWLFYLFYIGCEEDYGVRSYTSV